MASSRSTAWLAAAIWLSAVACAALGLLLRALNWWTPVPERWGVRGFDALTAATFATVGAAIAVRRASNPIGWLFCAAGLLLGIGVFVVEYAIFSLLTQPGRWPAGTLAAWIGNWLWIPAYELIVIFLFLLFPDGRLLSPRWRMVAWLAGVGCVALTLVDALAPGPLDDSPFVTNPVGIEILAGRVQVAFLAAFILQAWVAGAAVLALVLRFRRARGEVRQQLKWLVGAAALVVFSLFLAVLFYDVKLVQVLVVAAALGVPIAVGIAILRYRLYDIDIIINRALVYGTLTVALGLVYYGGVALLQRVVGGLTGQQGSPLAIVASTLAIAALFQPLRRRIQAFIDRRFYRRKYDAQQTLAAFSARLRDETDLDQLTAHLLAVVEETMQPAHVSLWLRPPERKL